MDSTEAFETVVALARQAVARGMAGSDEDRTREACDYVEYASAKLDIDEMPLSFEQWQDFTAASAAAG